MADVASRTSLPRPAAPPARVDGLDTLRAAGALLYRWVERPFMRLREIHAPTNFHGFMPPSPLLQDVP